MTIDLDTSSKREDLLIHTNVTATLIPNIKWKVDLNGAEYVLKRYKTYSGNTNSIKVFKYNKDLKATNWLKETAQHKNIYGLEVFSTMSVYYQNELLLGLFPKEFAELYKTGGIASKRKKLQNSIASNREKARSRNKEKAIEKKKEKSLDFNHNVQRDISRAIFISFLNMYLKDSGFKIKQFSIYAGMGNARVIDFFEHKKDVDVDYFIQASLRRLEETIDLTGKRLFKSLNKITDKGQEILQDLLFHENSGVRRFAVVYCKESTIGLLDKDFVTRAAAEKLINKEGDDVYIEAN